MPAVSVVMSVLNGERFLAEAVESILAQSFADFEFIIIDDGSTDRTSAILETYEKTDTRVLVHHQENKGLVEALNRGCALAHGKYIARIDADDVALQDRLKRQVEFMETHPGVALVGGSIECIDATGKPLVTHVALTSHRKIRAALLRGSCGLWHPTIMMRTDAFTAIGGYRKAIIDAEDYDLFLRMAERFYVANLENVVLKYRLHGDQVSALKFKRQALSSLAARAAAWSRQHGKPDPLDNCAEITPTMLDSLGVTDIARQTTIARAYVTHVRNMSRASASRIDPADLIQSIDTMELGQAGGSAVADLWLLVATLYYRDKKLLSATRSFCRALSVWPFLLLRPAKRLSGFIHTPDKHGAELT